MGRPPLDPDYWITAVNRVSTQDIQTTTAIHNEVVKIFRDKGIEDEEELPSWRTTYEKLKELEKKDRVQRRDLGNNTEWLPVERDVKEMVLSVLEERDTGTAEKLAEQIEDITTEEVRDCLRVLEDEGQVKSSAIDDREIWIIVS